MSLWSLIVRFIFRFLYNRPRPVPTPEDLHPARVAIIGAGVGGCFAAKFLRENGGKYLDIHVWSGTDLKIGGRTATCEFEGHRYELGASVIHSRNKYLSDAVKDYGFSKKGELDPSVPFGIFDGKRFLLRTGVFSIINSIKILWRYGLDLFRLKRSVSSLLDNFSSIYELQESGKAYSNLHDMLEAMGGEHMYGLTQVSAHDYMRGTLNWNEKLVDELITGALRVNYGQDTSVNAFTAYVALAGMEDGKLWSVVDGNWQIPAKVLEESAATVLSEDVTKVSKVVNQNGQTKYHINTSGGGDDGLDYDVVIVANPLNLSSVEYENFSGNVYTPAATTPYHTTVATFIKGIIKQDFFGEDPKQNNFPQNILTKDMEGCPIQFNSIGSEIPSEIKQDQVKDYTKPLQDDPMRVWKVFSNESHSPTDWQQIFTDIQSTFTKKWSAYPQYHPPDEAPPFILDDGVFYVNAIEKAASAMEMSAIGAKNAALLAREYILEQQKLFE